MGNFMSLLQLTKVIDAVNELALKVQKLEIQVQSILHDKHNLPKDVVVVDPIVNKKQAVKNERK
jgi:hypothetical protein